MLFKVNDRGESRGESSGERFSVPLYYRCSDAVQGSPMAALSVFSRRIKRVLAGLPTTGFFFKDNAGSRVLVFSIHRQ